MCCSNKHHRALRPDLTPQVQSRLDLLRRLTPQVQSRLVPLGPRRRGSFAGPGQIGRSVAGPKGRRPSTFCPPSHTYFTSAPNPKEI